MIGFRLGLTALVLVASSSAYAAHRGSMEDQLACTPDVYRLCASQVPDEDAIVACLVRNKSALSPDCSRVFAKPLPGTAKPLPGTNGENMDD